MNDDEFESWFVPSPRRLITLNRPNYLFRFSALLLGLACVYGLMWVWLK